MSTDCQFMSVSLCQRHLWSTDCQFMSVSLCETPLEYRLSVHVCFSVRDTFGVQTVSSCLFLCVSQRHLWSTDCQFMSVSLCQRHLWSTDCQFMSVSLCERHPVSTDCQFMSVSLCQRHLWSTDCQFMSVSLCESETPLEYRLSVHVCFSVSETPLEYRLSVHVCFSVRDTFGVQTVSSCLFLCVSQRHLWSTDCQFMSVSLCESETPLEYRLSVHVCFSV